MWEKADVTQKTVRALQEKRFSFRGNADSVSFSIPCLQRRLRGVNNRSFQKLENRRKLVDRNIRLSKCGFLLDAVDIRRPAHTLLLLVNWGIHFSRKLKGQKIFLSWLLRIDNTVLIRNTTFFACPLSHNYLTDIGSRSGFNEESGLLGCYALSSVSSSRRFERSSCWKLFPQQQCATSHKIWFHVTETGRNIATHYIIDIVQSITMFPKARVLQKILRCSARNRVG